MRHSSILLASAAMPRAITSVRAEGPQNPVDLIANIRTMVDTRLSAVEAAIDERATRDAADRLGQGSVDAAMPIDREYSAAFASYARGDENEAAATLRAANRTGIRQTIQSAMSVGDNSSGGYLAPVEWDRTIGKAQRVQSPMRGIARVVATGVGAYSTLWSNDTWGSGWVGETAARPATTTAALSPIVFPTGEIYAMPATTQRLLDDSQVDIAAWLSAALGEEFGRQEDIAFVSGDGVNKPMGFLRYVTGDVGAAVHPGGVLDVVASGNASTIPNGDILMDFKYGLAAPYRQNASWLMNSQTAAEIAKMKDGQGAYIWREGLADDQPTTLLGRPVAIDENMPNVAAGQTPIAFGDFQMGYVINDRFGVRIIRDPLTNKPFVMFYATKRVGGGVADPRAIRLLKVAAN